MIQRTLAPTRFPYTTLFRSFDPRIGALDLVLLDRGLDHRRNDTLAGEPAIFDGRFVQLIGGEDRAHLFDIAVAARSEEHTSELQSRLHLVCRVLLGIKKKRY